MNERIRQFAKEAGAYFGDASVDYFGEPHLAFVNTSNIDLEKFAELIVGECANKIAESFIPEDELIEDYKKDWDNTMRFAANSIKQHFGVDE